MNIPGFTAERSLYNGNARYQATTETSLFGGTVQLARSDIYHPRLAWCLKRECKNVAPAGYPPKMFCWPGFGIWNLVTQSCE